MTWWQGFVTFSLRPVWYDDAHGRQANGEVLQATCDPRIGQIDEVSNLDY